MDEEQYIAEKQGQIAVKMVEITSILSKKDLSDHDRERLQFCMGYILNVSKGKDKGFSTEISALARAITLRTLNDMYAEFGKALVVPFGNGGHVVVPKEHVDKTIRYVLAD